MVDGDSSENGPAASPAESSDPASNQRDNSFGIKELRKIKRDDGKDQLDLGLVIDQTYNPIKKKERKQQKRRAQNKPEEPTLENLLNIPSEKTIRLSPTKLGLLSFCDYNYYIIHVKKRKLPQLITRAFGVAIHQMCDDFYVKNYKDEKSFIGSFIFNWIKTEKGENKKIGPVRIIGRDKVIRVNDHSTEFKSAFMNYTNIGKETLSKFYQRFIKNRVAQEKRRIKIFDMEWKGFMEYLEAEKDHYEKAKASFNWKTIDNKVKQRFEWIKGNDFEKITKKGGFNKMGIELKKKALKYLELRYPKELSPITEISFNFKYKVTIPGSPIEYVQLEGRIDRIDDYKGYFWVTDYKTDKKKIEIAKDLNALKNPSHQFTVYYLAIKNIFNRKPKTMMKFHLRTGEHQVIPISDSHFRWLEEDVCTAVQKITSGKYRQNVGYQCNFCDNLSICLREIKGKLETEETKTILMTHEAIEDEISHHWAEIEDNPNQDA